MHVDEADLKENCGFCGMPLFSLCFHILSINAVCWFYITSSCYSLNHHTAQSFQPFFREKMIETAAPRHLIQAFLIDKLPLITSHQKST